MPTLPLNEITFSTSEFWLLLSQFSPAIVIGVENPYLGWLADEIEAAHRQAANSLLERGLARPLSDETIEVDDHLLSMAEACVTPRHTLVLQLAQTGERSDQRYFHIAKEWLVEHYEQSPNQHVLNGFTSRSQLFDHISQLLTVSPDKPVSGISFDLAETTLYQAAEICSQGKSDEAWALLNEAELGEKEAKAVISALTQPVFNASLAIIVNQGDPETQYVRGFGVLESKTDLWMMRPYPHQGSQRVQFISVDANTLLKHLDETLPGSSLGE